MKRKVTLVLLGLACLAVMPSIAQARYRDGMNMYQYVRSSPIGYVDWSGAAAQPTSGPSTLPSTAPSTLPATQPGSPSPGDVKPGQPGYFPFDVVPPDGYNGKPFAPSELTPKPESEPSLGKHPEGTPVKPKPGAPEQNCLGAACGLPNPIEWPGIGDVVPQGQLAPAKMVVPKGCTRVDCKGISYSRTRCKAPRCLELIQWTYWWPNEAESLKQKKALFKVRYHSIGRNIAGGLPRAWASKDAHGIAYVNITDPDAHYNKLYGKTMKLLERWMKAYPQHAGRAKTCFCCDPAKMKLKTPPKK